MHPAVFLAGLPSVNLPCGSFHPVSMPFILNLSCIEFYTDFVA
jgi:hypothetical protein